MKFFSDCNTLDELKKKYRKLAMENHPDRGGDEDTMKKINDEYDRTFPILKMAYNKVASEPTHETAESTRNEFYTQNGWKGKNYNLYLTTKEITAKIREYVKKAYPDCKFSVSFSSYSGGSTISVALVSGPYEALLNGAKHIQVNNYYVEREDRATEWAKAVMMDVNDFIKSYRFSDCDGMIDYFNVNFWYDLEIGKWNKPYTVNNKVKKISGETSSNEVVPVDGSGRVTIIHNEEKNGIELYFKEKPDSTVINKLKENGFRWHSTKKCWYCRKSEKVEQLANALAA